MTDSLAKYQPPHVAARIAYQQRLARSVACPQCGAPVLVGPDADRVALDVTVDPDPVDALHEAVALLTGRAGHSYDFDGLRLHIREPWHLTNPQRRYDVLLSHVCKSQRCNGSRENE